MPYCPHCGAEVTEDVTFCPKCGASLKGTQAVRQDRRRNEKAEKGEKQEKGEKSEKREHPFIWPLIGGLILIFLGIASYLQTLGYDIWRYTGAYFLIIIGLAIILGALVRSARKRNPPT